MKWPWWLVILLVAVAAKKKHRHQKPGRALLDRLAGSTVGEVRVSRDEGGPLPVPLDVAPYVAIVASATCGDAGAEEYCRDMPGKRGVVCDVCEGLDGPPSRRHPAAHAVDGDPATWWQSPSMATGDYGHVNLVATLPDKMELLNVIVKVGPSPRPLAWSLEVSASASNEEWRLVRAFGDRDHCRRLWDLRPERRRRKARAARRTSRAEKPTCSTQFMSPKPLENGEMHVSLGEGVPARRVRVSFRAAHAQAAAHQYYTVRALTLAARCLCHGHARACHVDHQGARCACEGGMCGAHCQRCCAGGGGGACEERGACAYDDTGAILCVNCTDNRAGPLCDRCQSGFYNLLSDGPCVPCDCDPEGSDGSCKWDPLTQHVECTCKVGFGGARCDACANEGGVFPACAAVSTPPDPSEPPGPSETPAPACKCDPKGIVDPERICDDICECKENVVGERCDTCAAGHFRAADGCARCYCAHVAHACAPAAPPHPAPAIILPMGEAWTITDSMGNATVEPSISDDGKPYLASYEVEGWKEYYWVTYAWNGMNLAWYGGEIVAALQWELVRGDTGGNPTQGPDVALLGQDGARLWLRESETYSVGGVQIRARLTEDLWVDDEGAPAARAALMDVLRDLRGLMLRAHFHYDQDEVRLESAEVFPGEGSLREQCACPAGYQGAHCEVCAAHHVAVDAPPPARRLCLPCPCHNHADCRSVDGPCGECQHNTTGPHCERCLPGHYGNPVQGGCKPCACPLFLPSNNFSPNCALADAEGDEFVCTQCPEGYTGDHCESCDVGYWGSPTEVGGGCRRCECGGAPCDRAGACRACPPHAEGARCDQCQEGYWVGELSVGGAVPASGCVPCACGVGALAAACDARSGQCACRAGYTGRACGACAPPHADPAAGCPACRCGAAAAAAACDAATGACACAPGAAPPRCERCLDHHYGLNAGGCLGCNCSKLGSESEACDIRTGQCRCKPHVAGRACDTCEEGYWGLQQGGCRRCSCGPGAATCDATTGACRCAPGAGGQACDECLPGHYGLSPAGCLPCPDCGPGKVCSAESGRCVCPRGARGPRCQHCAAGYARRGGRCQPCRCGPGATSEHCDEQSGQCRCRAGWAGARCERCAARHAGPRCRPCQCGAGTRACGDQPCPCDDDGRCPCKENVVGDKCSECLEGTFGLSAENPLGCTACFCFGRATRCTQAQLARAALRHAAPAHLTLVPAPPHYSVDENSLIGIPMEKADSTIAVPWPPVPVYVEVPRRFLGDRVTSYGGFLRFRLEEEGGEPLPPRVLAAFPLVRVYGADGIVLNHYQRIPAVNGTYAVRLHESLWEVRVAAEATEAAEGASDATGAMAAEAHASRGVLLAALRHVRRIMLRASTRAPAADDPAHALVLNVSLDTTVAGLSRSAPALGVEVCECAAGYGAASCQAPAVGFWLPAAAPRLHAAAGTITISVRAAAAPCRCHGRAAACHPDTGACLNCTSGTGGAQCERCASGYYGSPATGCHACPCPSTTHNFATACSVGEDRVQCFCKPGYAGPDCGACAEGWRRAGAGPGRCEPCACDPRGAAPGAGCEGGRCRCRPHAQGARCDRCKAPRTHLADDGRCLPCDNCTQTLLDSIEQLTSEFHSRADLSELGRIPQPYPALLELSHNVSSLQSALNSYDKGTTNINTLVQTISQLEEREHNIFTEANRLKLDALMRDKQSHYLSLESMSGLEEVLKLRRKVGEQVALLDDFARGERHLTAHRALKEARHLLKSIKEIRLDDFLGGVNDVFATANVQSTAVQEYEYRVSGAQRRARRLREGAARWERAAADARRLAGGVRRAADGVRAAAARLLPRRAALATANLSCSLLLQDISAMSAHNLTAAVGAALRRSSSLLAKLPSQAAELAVLARAAEEKEGILYSLTPLYRDKYLLPVERHVAELGRKAEEFKKLLSGSRAASSLGVAAARAWGGVAGAVAGAGAAADRASAAAAAARAAAATAAAAASSPLPASRRLRDRAEALLARAEEVRGRLSRLSHAGDAVDVSLRALGWAERELAAGGGGAGGLTRRVADPLASAGARAERVFGTARATYSEAAELRRRARYALRRRLADLARLGDTHLGAAQEHVSQIRGNTERGAELAAALSGAAAARARDRAAAAGALPPRLGLLRRRVLQARHAAASVSVSVTSPSGAPAAAGCSRLFAAAPGSPAASRLALAVSFDRAVRDGPLLYLLDDEHEKERYMKLEVSGGRMRVRWQLGAGEALLSHPTPLLPALDDADHTTYKVDVDRIWNTVHLRVEQLGGGGPVTVSNASNPAATQLMPSKLWLGGTGVDGGEAGVDGGEDGVEGGEDSANGSEAGVDGGDGANGGNGSAGLPGCVHSLRYDDESIGLWNFHHQPPQAKCSGCTQRGAGRGTGAGAGMAWFNGGGYARLERSGRRADAAHLSVAFTFRTSGPDALLFYAADETNNRSVSIFLRSCRVVFLVAYGGGARLEIESRSDHCGHTAHVQATRLFHGNLERGSLRVNGEETLGSAEPLVTAAALLPAPRALWLGGAGPALGGRGPAVGGGPPPVPPLRGCLGALAVDRAAYQLLDTAARHGVEPSCDHRIARSAVLEGNGFIELPSPSLRRKGSLGLAFRAKAGGGGGLLLHRPPRCPHGAGDDDDHYLTLLLEAGELHLIASAGKAELRMTSNGTKFDDGAMHVLRLVRAHKQIELWVDDNRLANGVLPGNAYPARARCLFLGGIPPTTDPEKTEPAPTANPDSKPPSFPTTGFTGTIADFVVDTQLVDLETAVARAGARLGRHAAAPAPPPALRRHSLCAKSASYTVEAGAARFGDAAWSHAAVRLPRGRLAVSLQFRTYRPAGVLLLVPGTKQKPKHYTALVVREGRLRLVVRGRRRRELALDTFVADGTWRPVSVVVTRTHAELTSGAEAARAAAGGAARGPALYVGGLPAPLPALPKQILRLGGLVGCVRRAEVGGRRADLGRGQRALGQCFPGVTRAAYLPGDAYARISNLTEEDTDDVHLQLRTHSPRGLLLATKTYVVELKEGKAILTRLGATAAEAEAAVLADGPVVCDGGWHRLAIRRGRLLLDGPALDAPRNRPHPHPSRDRELYIGGLPEGATEWDENGRENFKGCIKDVWVGGEERDLRPHGHRVLLDSCPAPP